MSETGQTIIKAVREAAERSPLYVYEGHCQYIKAGAPSCLVGHALWDLGMIDLNFARGTINNEGIDAVLPMLGIEVDHSELVWLEVAQTAQDTQSTWQEAVRQADEFDPSDMW